MTRIKGSLALRIVGNVFLGVGLAGLTVTAGTALFELYSDRHSSAEGTIIGFEYGPKVQFTTQDGQIIQFSSSVRSSLWHKGDRVLVTYAPDNPVDVKIDGFAGRWFLPTLFGLLASVFLLIGIILRLATFL